MAGTQGLNHSLLLIRSQHNSSHLLLHAAIPSQLLFATWVSSALPQRRCTPPVACTYQWGATHLLAPGLYQHSTKEQKMTMNLSTATLIDGEQEDLLVQPMRSTTSLLPNN